MSVFNKTQNKSVRSSDIKKQYASLPSFSDKLPWFEWSDKHDLILLEDARSVGAAFEIKAVPTEARPEAQINALHNKLVRLLSTLLPLEDDNPWVMQIFIEDDTTLIPIYKALVDYIAKFNNLDDPLAKKYLEIMKEHFALMCRQDGIFTDPMSNLAFRGKIRRIRITLYRRYTKLDKNNLPNVVEEIDSVCKKFTSQMQQVGIKINRLKAKQFYAWLVRWFNPNPKRTNGNIDELLGKYSYPENDKPFGWNFSQNIFFDNVESYSDGWIFDGMKHKVMTFCDLDSPLEVGAISREMNLGENQKYALLDKFPLGAIYTIQISFESKAAINKHLDGIESAGIGKSSIVKDIHANIERARYEMDNGHMLFRSVEAIYFKGKNDEDLKQQELMLQSLLDSVQLSVIDTKSEIYPKDLYLRFLPFNFNYAFDKQHNFRSSYKYASDVAKLLPLYGRSQGDGQNPLHLYYNRGGEIFMFDHLSTDFKMANSHMAIVGTTGAGKSVLLNNMCLSLSATRNPRIIVMEVGGSFDLTAKFLAKYGRDVKSMKFDRMNPIAVNPYAEAYKALEIIEIEEAVIKARNKTHKQDVIREEVLAKHHSRLTKEITDSKNIATQTELQCQEDRDILNEMVIATRVMITQGNKSEEAKIDPTDLSLITRALITAMKTCKKQKIPQMLLSHVINSINKLADKEGNQELQSRLKQFALRLEYYTHGIRGQFINQPSKPLIDFDFLHIDFGFMQSESYKDLLNIVCISLLAKVLALAEANKATGRPTELFMDEAHVLFKSDMVAAFVILMAKVARKIGLWLKPCTQNIEDFTGIESKKVLSMMETWLCLALEADEVALINKFKPLSAEMKNLILDVRKYPGLYAEGVLLGKRHSGLFRNIPPRIALALAMTEQDERTARKKLQQELNITELEAVEHIAKQMISKNPEISDAKFFLY